MYTSYPLATVLSADSVTTSTIQDGAVTEPKLASNAVATAKIADAAVTDSKLAADSVITVKIANSNVTRAKIADEAINADKVAAADVDNIKTKLIALTPVNDNGTDLGASNKRVRVAFIGTSIDNAGNLGINLSGAATRTLTLQNPTSGQVANLEVDGELFFRGGTSYSIALANDAASPLTANRAAYFPDASGRVILDSDVRASRIRVPLVNYASVDIASPATQTIGLFIFNPSEYAVPGKTTVLSFKALGGLSAGSGTVSLYNLTTSTEDASITLTGTLTSLDSDTDTVALPGSTTSFAVRASVGTDGEYMICGAYLDITWI